MDKTTPPESGRTLHDGGVTLYGPDAMKWMKAIALRSSLKFYAKTGMKMTRVATPTMMLTMASEFSGKPYKRGEYDKAVADLDKWIETMRYALPCEDQRTEKK